MVIVSFLFFIFFTVSISVKYIRSIFHPILLVTYGLLVFRIGRGFYLSIFEPSALKNQMFYSGDTSRFIDLSIIYVSIGFLFFLLAFNYTKSIFDFRRFYNSSIIGFNSSKLFRLGWIIIILISVYYFFQIIQSGSYAKFIYRSRLGELPATNLIKLLLSLAGYFTLLHNFHFFKKMNALEVRNIIPLIAVSSLFFLAGDRNSAVYFLLFTFMGYYYYIRRVKLYLLGIFILFVVFFANYAAERRIAYVLQASEKEVFENNKKYDVNDFFTSVNAHTYDNFVLLVKDYNYDSFLLGELFFNGFVGFIPRSIWPEKPKSITSGRWFTDQYYPDALGGKPITPFGEWYVNFGVLGIWFGMFLSGLIIKMFWNSLVKNPNDPTLLMFYIIYFFNLSSYGFVSTGTFMSVIFYILPILFVLNKISKSGKVIYHES